MAKINPIQLQKHLSGVDYPASKEALARQAEQNGADDEVRAILGRLPDGEYRTPADVSKAVGDLNDEDGEENGGGGDQGRSGGRPGSASASARQDDREDDEDAGGNGGAKINPIQLQKHLGGVDYPASREDLVHQAEANGADDEVRAVLGRLPDGEYQTPADVNKAVGQLNRDRE